MLHIGTTGTETKFLPENELPSHSRLTHTGPEEEAAAEAAMKDTAAELEANEIRKAIEKSKIEQGKYLSYTITYVTTLAFSLFLFSFFVIKCHGHIITYARF